jgi:toxin ParE1/3/4
MTVYFHAEARAEFDRAIDWLQQDAGLGDDFTTKIHDAIERIAERPETHSAYEGRVRYRHVEKYRYVLLFLIRDDGIEIISVMHTSRRPGFWKDRLN